MIESVIYSRYTTDFHFFIVYSIAPLPRYLLCPLCQIIILTTNKTENK